MRVTVSLVGESAREYGSEKEFLRAHTVRQTVIRTLVVTTEMMRVVEFPWRDVTAFTVEDR